MYTDRNFKTKKALKEAVAAGDKISVFQPNDFFNTPIPQNGKVCVEGPQYPRPHTWYASVTLKDGYIVKVS
jgi:hypothetical protein